MSYAYITPLITGSQLSAPGKPGSAARPQHSPRVQLRRPGPTLRSSSRPLAPAPAGPLRPHDRPLAGVPQSLKQLARCPVRLGRSPQPSTRRCGRSRHGTAGWLSRTARRTPHCRRRCLPAGRRRHCTAQPLPQVPGHSAATQVGLVRWPCTA